MKISDLSKKALGAIALCAVFGIVLTACFMPASDADDASPRELTLYGYTITMGLTEPDSVATVEWDFGDGSAKETVTISETNANGTVKHKYESKGDYTVTATLRNTYTDTDGVIREGETTITYVYHIMGYPIVTFDTDNGSEIASIEEQHSQYVPAKPKDDPVKEGYNFTGWFADKELEVVYDWSAAVTEHTTIYAGWEKIVYTVSFDLHGADVVIDSQTIEYGETVKEPTTPARDGFIFKGWMKGDDAYDFTAPVTSSFTLVADWEQKEADKVYHTVSFDANGGKAQWSQRDIVSGNSITLPTATKEGFTLDGWFIDNVKIGDPGASYTVTGDANLKARWTEKAAEPAPGEKDTGKTLAIILGVAAVLCIVALIVTGIVFLGIPAAVLAILAALFVLGVF